MTVLKVLVTLHHLCQLVIKGILVTLNPLDLLHRVIIFQFLLLIGISKTCLLLLNFQQTLLEVFILVIELGVSWHLGLMQGKFLLKGLFLSDKFFVFSRHEMRILHLSHRFNSVTHENRLVMQRIRIVLHRWDATRVYLGHSRVSLEQLRLMFHTLSDHLINW